MPTRQLTPPAGPSSGFSVQRPTGNTNPSTEETKNTQTKKGIASYAQPSAARPENRSKRAAIDDVQKKQSKQKQDTKATPRVAVPEGLAKKTLERIGRNFWGDKYDEVRPALTPEELKKVIEGFQEAIDSL